MWLGHPPVVARLRWAPHGERRDRGQVACMVWFTVTTRLLSQWLKPMPCREERPWTTVRKGLGRAPLPAC